MFNTKGNVYLALLHYPVCNKNGEIIASALTNLDVHDIARSAKTFGIRTYFVVTPTKSQHQLLHRILNHWREGFGGKYNKERKEALLLVKAAYDLEEVIECVSKEEGKNPLIVMTSARAKERCISYSALRDKIRDGHSLLLVFGTGWGLAEEAMVKADYLLPPISGGTEYNHLAVRSAAAIIVDRLLGRQLSPDKTWEE